MPSRLRRSVVVFLVVSVAAPAAACLWDYDTLQMERERFPGALELIVGKFLRHTDEFYEWRVKDRRAKIAAHDAGEKKLTDEELGRAYDDLAAALDKLKKHDEAIAVIREKAERLPKVGEYETHANLGTFLVHSGRLEEGVAELKKAIEINPEAHFGREKYQVLVVEYVMPRRGDDGKPRLPLEGSFGTWVLQRAGIADDQGRIEEREGEEARAELQRAAQGILGMMRFGDYRSPVLLETLGDVMLSAKDHTDEDDDAQRLAARAFLRAAEAASSSEAKVAYRDMAQGILFDQMADRKAGERSVEHGRELSLASIEDHLHREVKEADEWFATTIAHDEELWVKESADPDRRFWEKYGGQEIRVGHDRLPPAQFVRTGLPWTLRAALGGAAVVTVAAVVGALYWRRRRPTGYGGDPRER